MARIVHITAIALALSGTALSGSASARGMGGFAGHPPGSFGGMTTFSRLTFSQPNGGALSGRYSPLPQGLGGNSGFHLLPQPMGANGG
jgi:hypothetical protein